MYRHNNDAPVRASHDVMRAGLMIGRKSEPSKRFYRIDPIDIRRKLQASASCGSVAKCSRTVSGAFTPRARK